MAWGLAWALLATPAGPARALPVPDCRDLAHDCTLRQTADQAGVRMGAAAVPRLVRDDPRYGPTLAREFNSLTAENAMKWPQLSDAPGRYDFEEADALVAFAEANGMRVRGHTLVWANPERLPGFVGDLDSAEEARALLHDHIRTVAGRYAGRVDAWDVVNEPLTLGNTFYDNAFHRLLGPDYIAEAFRVAHEAAPDATLFLNEVLVEMPGNVRFDTFHELVAGLVADGVPIHGVGLQAHLLDGLYVPSAAQLEAAVRAFADLGLVVELTELDVAMAPGPDRLARQGEIYEAVVGACLAVAACQGVTTWGLTDRYTWIDDFIGPDRVPLPLDVDYGRKPAWYGTREALRARIVPEPGAAALWLLAWGTGVGMLRLPSWRSRIG